MPADDDEKEGVQERSLLLQGSDHFLRLEIHNDGWLTRSGILHDVQQVTGTATHLDIMASGYGGANCLLPPFGGQTLLWIKINDSHDTPLLIAVRIQIRFDPRFIKGKYYA